MSGRLTLAARGIQDRWLTEEPQYSHFLYRYRRHTKFAFEQIEFPFDRFQEYGNEMTCQIPTNAGDLLKGVTLMMDLPPPRPTNENNVTYTLEKGTNPGELLIDGELTTELRVYQGVQYTFISSERFEVVNGVNANDWSYEVIGSDHVLTLRIQINIVDNYTACYIRPYEDDVYQIALKVRQIRWNRSTPTKMIKYADILIGGQTIQRITGEFIYMYNQLYYTQNDADFTLVATTLHNSYPIINDDTYERYTSFQKYKIQLPFYFNGHPSLSIPVCALNKQLVEVKVKFKPVDDLTIEYDMSSDLYFATTIKSSTTLRNLSLVTDFVYVSQDEKNFILTRPIEYVITQTQLADIKMDPGISRRLVMVNFKHPVKELFFIAVNDATKEHVPIKNVTLKFNNNIVIDADNLQLSAEQPMKYHTNSINENYEFGIYSFSLKPEVYYPTGQVNMSRVIHKLLDVELNVSDTSKSHTLHVYASNYNVLRVAHGIAGLKF